MKTSDTLVWEFLDTTSTDLVLLLEVSRCYPKGLSRWNEEEYDKFSCSFIFVVEHKDCP